MGRSQRHAATDDRRETEGGKIRGKVDMTTNPAAECSSWVARTVGSVRFASGADSNDGRPRHNYQWSQE